jgi:hypothetical protein
MDEPHVDRTAEQRTAALSWRGSFLRVPWREKVSATTETTAATTDTTAARHGRLNIKINATTSQALRQLSDDDATPTEVIRRAVALMKLVDDKRREGKAIEFVSGDGKSRERLELLY